MVCDDQEVIAFYIWPKLLDRSDHSETLSFRDAIIALRLRHRAAGELQHSLLAVYNLEQDGADASVASVCLYNGLGIERRPCEHWSRGYKHFDLFKGFLLSIAPLVSPILFSKRRQRLSDRGEVLQEFPVSRAANL